MILVIVTFAFVIILTNNAFPQRLHDKTLYEIVNQPYSKIHSKIDVGKIPASIGINQDINTIYVANSGSNTVSVISGKNYTKKAKDISVGNGPVSIAINEQTNTVYIANFLDNSISVIDGEANEAVAGITFQIKPLFRLY